MRWFTELAAADAHQWVMVANVAHMSGLSVTPAGGGAPRPLSRRAYVCSSAYLRRMTDLPPGEWEERLDALYYAYLERAPPGSGFYRAALGGARYLADRPRWASLARAAAAELAGRPGKKNAGSI